MNCLKTLTLLCCLVFVSVAFAVAQSDSQGKQTAEIPISSVAQSQEAKSPQWNFAPEAPTVETSLAALSLHGPTAIDKITEPDLDLIITQDNKRLIPLLRILRIMSATGELRDDILTFEVESGPGAIINLRSKNMKVKDEIIPVDIIIGISDVTNAGEVYISEDVFKYAFGLDFTWDENFFQYVIKTEEALEIFTRRRPKSVSAFSIKVQEVLEPLPETEPPVHPLQSKPLLSFFESDQKMTANWRWRNKTGDYELDAQPKFTTWGNVLGGDYKIKARNTLDYPNTEFPKLPSWLDRAIWSSRKKNHILNIGDTNIGLSDLVAPSVSLFGTSFKWLSSPPEEERASDRFFEGTRFSFLNFETIDGIARLNSTVELWVNNRLVDTKTVEEVYDAPPGYGTYRFEDISLLDRTINEIKIVVKREDGIVEEFYREIIGTSQFLAPGEWAVVGGLGTDRQEVDEEIKTKGAFSGVQVYHGVSKDLTLGLTAALQDKFASLVYENGEEGTQSTGYYLAQQVKYKLFDRFLFTTDVSNSFDSINPSALGYILGLEYPRKRSRLAAKFFSYDPFFSNARTSISDRQGYNLSGRWIFFKDWSLQTGWLQIHNNLDGNLANAEKEDLLNTNISIPNLIPESVVWLQRGFLDSFDSAGKQTTGTVYAVGFDTSLIRRFNISGRYSFGDQITISSSDGLKSGLSLDLGTLYSFGTELKANYQLNDSHSITVSYWESSFQEQVEIASRYTSRGERPWSNRFEVGNKLDTATFYANDYLEFRLNNEGTHRWGIQTRFDEEREDYYFGVYVTLNDLFGINKEGVSHISSRSVTPEQGGVMGVVYLDLNSNGHRDKGEPGVPNISILADGRKVGLSDGKGVFYIPRRERNDMVEISFDMDELLAVYSPTQGIQKAYWKKGFFTEVNLGLTVVSSLSGTVQALALKPDGSIRTFAGVRVLLKAQEEMKIVKDSISANDGSYYIGDIRPGKYVVVLDETTIPPEFEQKQPFPQIEILPTQELNEIEDFVIDLVPRKNQVSSDASAGMSRKFRFNKVLAAKTKHIDDYASIFIVAITTPCFVFPRKRNKRGSIAS